jgi:hypothetical protein
MRVRRPSDLQDHLAGAFWALFMVSGLLLVFFGDIANLGGKDWRDLTTHARCSECGHVQRMNAERAIAPSVFDKCDRCGDRSVRPYNRI